MATHKNKGFTLVELIVAMGIAALLAAIAIPAYSTYVRKARRTDAKSAILDLASLEERYYTTTNAYTNVEANLGYAAAGSTATVPATPGTTPATELIVGSGYYQVTIPTITAGSTTTPAQYTITATAVGDQLKDTSCYQFSVTQSGLRTAVNSALADNTANCW